MSSLSIFSLVILISGTFGNASSTQPTVVGTQNGLPKLLEVGSLAPQWELTNSEGQKRKLRDYKNKIVIMDFWATWCAPCVKSQPGLQRIHETYKKDVVVLGMDCGERPQVDINAYKIQKKLDYEMILNSEKIQNTYKIAGLPTVYVIGRTGKIVYAATGYGPKSETELISAIEAEMSRN